MKKVVIALGIAVLLVSGLVAQTTATQDITITIPQIRLLRLLTDAPISLTLGGTVTPGDAPTQATNATDYLQYTVLNPVGVTQQITVALATGTVPAGTTLAVSASGSSLGTPQGEIPISGTAQKLIGSIGSGFTGTGSSAGMLLSYKLSVADSTLLQVNSGSSVQVQYTILDN